MNYLVLGGAGFIGSDFVRLLSQRNGVGIVVVDSLTYAGHLARIQDLVEDGRVSFVQMDARNPELADYIVGADVVVNFAAETHVDRSNNPETYETFVGSNVGVVANVLRGIMKHPGVWFHQVSTDEVYGPTVKGSCTEASEVSPKNFYAATKASADLLVQAHANVHPTNWSITRCCNNVGPWQEDEKLVPKVVRNVLLGETIPVYGNGLQQREWIHIRDHNRAILHVIENRLSGVWNVGTGACLCNIDLIRRVCNMIDTEVRKSAVLRSAWPSCFARTKTVPSTQLIRLVEDRPGHDVRYALNSEKLRATGWSPSYDTDHALDDTITWSLNHLASDIPTVVDGLV